MAKDPNQGHAVSHRNRLPHAGTSSARPILHALPSRMDLPGSEVDSFHEPEVSSHCTHHCPDPSRPHNHSEPYHPHPVSYPTSSPLRRNHNHYCGNPSHLTTIPDETWDQSAARTSCDPSASHSRRLPGTLPEMTVSNRTSAEASRTSSATLVGISGID